jgi:hypothetical protein
MLMFLEFKANISIMRYLLTKVNKYETVLFASNISLKKCQGELVEAAFDISPMVETPFPEKKS